MPASPTLATLLAAASLLASPFFLPSPAHARSVVPPRSVSQSRQFIIYCDNAMARGQVAGFAEETKRQLLALFGEKDRWKYPIIVNLATPGTASPTQPPSRVGLYETEGGFKAELSVTLDADPRAVRFHQQIVRALLLEYAYRAQPSLIRSGVRYADPPEWLVEGVVEMFRTRESGCDAEIFKTLVSRGKAPALAEFLAMDFDKLDATSRQLFTACALNLVQLLVELPDGRTSLGKFVRGWRGARDQTIDGLIKHFPMLGLTSQSLEKWWSLSLARLSASKRHEGLSLQETEQRLAPLLTFEIPVPGGNDNATEEKRSFSIEQFEEYKKFPASRAALARMSAGLIALDLEASSLFRPVLAEYQQIATDLSRGKTRRIKERLTAVTLFREKLAHRLEEISDYLNWFEATQNTSKSGSFDDYIKTANAISLPSAPQREDAITQYISRLERQLE